MLSVNIICVGKLKEKYWQSACAEYSKRLGAYCKFSITEIDEYRISGNPSSGDISVCLKNEGERILNKLPSNAKVYALCIEGKGVSSEKLAKCLQSDAVNGKSSIVFVIGGSYGLSQQVKERADFKLSMSDMTFPHQLARVMLCEQVYRAFSIINDGKYHK